MPPIHDPVPFGNFETKDGPLKLDMEGFHPHIAHMRLAQCWNKSHLSDGCANIKTMASAIHVQEMEECSPHEAQRNVGCSWFRSPGLRKPRPGYAGYLLALSVYSNPK